jgi:4-hydroxybenzoate polyprenyltransferase
MPARFGWRGALWVSRALHLIAITCLLMALVGDDRLGVLFMIAIGLVALLLIAEHGLLITRGKAGIPMAFFTLNGVVSVVLGTLGCIEIAMS